MVPVTRDRSLLSLAREVGNLKSTMEKQSFSSSGMSEIILALGFLILWGFFCIQEQQTSLHLLYMCTLPSRANNILYSLQSIYRPHFQFDISKSEFQFT